MFRTEINVITGEKIEIPVFPEEIIVNLEQEKRDKINQCLQYLKDTDWYIVRMSDPSSATIAPENVLINRANARTWQVDIKNCQTLEELNEINIIWQ